MARGSESKPVGRVVKQLLTDLGIQNRIHEQVVLEQFERIMGAEFCRRARAVKIERGVLFLEVIHSAWRQELFYQKQFIRDRLNAALGEHLVREIIFG